MLIYGGGTFLLRILHSADLHIGMSFNNYPEEVGQELQQARLDSLDPAENWRKRRFMNVNYWLLLGIFFIVPEFLKNDHSGT